MDTISFNGKTYASIEEMPADQRAAYEHVTAFMKDENHNGIPDLFEGNAIQKMMSMVSTRILVNGQEVQGVDALPPEARAKFDKAMAKLNQLGIIPPGTPAFPAQSHAQSAPQIAPVEPAFTQSPSFMQSSSPSAISDDAKPRTGIIIAALVAFLLCGLTLAAAFLFLSLNR